MRRVCAKSRAMNGKCEKRNYAAWVSGIPCGRDAKFEVYDDLVGFWKKLCAHHAVRYKKSGYTYRVLSEGNR